jgi:heptose-I-phosphate ethanolaminephosphotransferase
MRPNIKTIFRIIYSYITYPIKDNWIFLIIFGLLISGNASIVPFRFPHGGWEFYWGPSLAGISRSMVIAYMAAFIVKKFNNAGGVKWIFYSIGLFVFIISAFLLFDLNTAVSPSSLLLLIETNSSETTDFLFHYVFRLSTLPYLILLAVLILIIVLSEKRLPKILYTSKYNNIFSCLFMLTFVFGVYNYFAIFNRVKEARSNNDIETLFILGSLQWGIKGIYSDFTTNLLLSTIFLNDLNHTTHAWEKLNATIYETKSIPKITDNTTVVLIIGESHSKLHSSIYGYFLPTYPNLAQERDSGNLFVYENMVTPFANTSKSIKNIMTLNSLGDSELWYKSAFFPLILNMGGYKVSLWDNQNDFSKNSLRASYDVDLSYFQTADVFTDNCYSFIYGPKHDYDGDMIDQFVRNHTNEFGPHFTWIHLMGQHINAANRFPKDNKWMYFKTSDYSRSENWMTEDKKQDIANYDNACRYNDYQLKRIIDYYRDSTAVIIYLSDHGEEVYDYQDNLGRKGGRLLTQESIRCLYEIPFVIWCSNKYQEKYPEIINDIKSSTTRRGMTDNIGHLIFHLSGLTDGNSFYIPSRDILSSQYSCPRRILNGTTDYDSIMKSQTHKE